MRRVLYPYLIILTFLLLPGCGDDDNPFEGDGYDRKAMLTNWADKIIMPAYENYTLDLEILGAATIVFNGEPNEENLELLRNAWLGAYLSWQWVSMFEIGKAESLTLRDFTNIYPTDAAGIEDNIASGSYNLELPSSRDQQGFPAMDYLLFGTGVDDAAIVSVFQNSAAHRNYLLELIVRLDDLTNQVHLDWHQGYRDTFINNDGSTASSSVNKLVNDYLFYYEKALRAGKIGIPAGVFSSTTLSDQVEGFYSQTHSRLLFENALEASIAFFNGQHFGSSTTGESLASYLDFVNAITEGEDLSESINSQFISTQSTSTQLMDNLYLQVESDNSKMLSTYDELQKNVVLMKVDMLQALNIKVDYVDADGD